jgi:hypothetical protein
LPTKFHTLGYVSSILTLASILIASTGLADPHFEQGLCNGGAGGGNLGEIQPGNIVNTCLRYDDLPSTFVCEYQWVVAYDPADFLPLSADSLPLPTGYGPGTLLPPVFCAVLDNQPPVGFATNTSRLFCFINDADPNDGLEPLRGTQFSPVDQNGEIKIHWEILITDPFPGAIVGLGGQERFWVSSICTGIANFETNSSNIIYTPEPHEGGLLAGIVLLYFLRRKKKVVRHGVGQIS